MTREEVIEELQRVAKSLGKDSLPRTEFRRHGQFSASVVERTFGSWNEAIKAAGLMPITRFRGLPDAELQEEFQRVYQLLGKPPTRDQFAAHAELSPGVYERRFGKWSEAVAYYTGTRAATGTQTVPTNKPRPITHRFEPRSVEPSSGRPRRAYGPPLNFRELRHEPLNELGVVHLFGMVAGELGFLVEAIAAGYPDCSAKRRTKSHGRTYYESVDIEFEFKSTNFIEHGHDLNACDLIVCWEHDWRDCPVEVLELRTVITQLHQPARDDQ